MARSGGSTVIAKGSSFVAPLEERPESITTRTPNFGILTSIAANSGSTIRLDGSFHKEGGKTDQELARRHSRPIPPGHNKASGSRTRTSYGDRMTR